MKTNPSCSELFILNVYITLSTHICDNTLDLGLDNSSQKQVLATHHDKMSDWGGNFFHHRVPLSTLSPLI